MPINSFRGDTASASKRIRLLKPTNTVDVQPTIRVNNKTIEFENWNGGAIAAAINNSELPELAEVEAVVVEGDHVDIVGPVNEDFEVYYTQAPTATVTNVAGENPRSQKTLITFGGATGGTYVLKINDEATAAITFGSLSDARTKIDALSGVAPADYDLSQQGDDYQIAFKGAFASAGVKVEINGAGLVRAVGAIVQTKTAVAIPARYDVYALAISGSSQVVLNLDGKSDVIYSDDSLAVVRAKIQAMTSGGRSVKVWGGRNTEVAVPANRAFYILEFDGYSTLTRPTISISSGSGEVRNVYDPTTGIAAGVLDGTSSSMVGQRREMILFDFNEDSTTMKIEIDGVEVSISPSMDVTAIRDALNNASAFYEWTQITQWAAWGGTIGAVMPSKMRGLAFGRSVGVVEDSYIRKISGGGTLRRIQRGGTNTAGASFELYRTPASISGGTFTLDFIEGTTAAIAWNATAANVQSAAAAVVTGATVSRGDGSAADPWRLQLPATSVDPDQSPAIVTTFTEPTSGTVATTQSATPGKSARAIVTVATRAASGSYRMRYGSQGPVDFTPGLSAGAFKTLLQQFPGLATSGDTSVSFDATSGRYEITFSGSLANKVVPSFEIRRENVALFTAEDETGAEVIVRPTGPGNFAEPKNWTLGRLPENGDDVVLDSGTESVEYGLRQYVAFTVNATTNVFTAVGGHDFAENQKIRFFTVGGSLPSPLVGATDYFVLACDYTRGTFQVATTESGAPVNVTTAGSGGLYCGVKVRALRILSTFTAAIGLEEQNGNGFREYRNRYLRLGVAEIVDIGEGSGGGSGLLRIDFGDSGPTVRVIATASPTEAAFPSVNFLALSETLRLATLEGSVGVAAGDNEVAILSDVGLHGGETVFGNVTVRRDLLKTAGAMTARELAVQGIIRVNQ